MRKGFTLIELLAVIVILAIIAVIATPIVLNIINDSKNSATIRSAEFYSDAVQQAIMKKKTTTRGFRPSYCEVQEDGNVLCDGDTVLEIEVDGERPTGGVLMFSDGKVTSMELFYEAQVIRQEESGELVQDENYGKSSTEKIIYFDVSKGTACKESDYVVSNSNTGYNGIDNRKADQNGCLKFYLFNDTGGNTVTLLLDHNTTAMVPWNSSGINTDGPREVLNQLKLDTQNWKGTITPANYVEETNNAYTINYSGYKARLLTAIEIARFLGYDDWNERGYYYFDSNTILENEKCTTGNTSECKYGWLYDRTSVICKSNGCLYNSDVDTAGYWTATYRKSLSSTDIHVEMCNGYVSYGVSHRARMGYACVNNTEHYGVRPAIIVSRNNIS